MVVLMRCIPSCLARLGRDAEPGRQRPVHHPTAVVKACVCVRLPDGLRVRLARR